MQPAPTFPYPTLFRADPAGGPRQHDRVGVREGDHRERAEVEDRGGSASVAQGSRSGRVGEARKSTRLNSSHSQISYVVFCLYKKTMVSWTPCLRLPPP